MRDDDAISQDDAPVRIHTFLIADIRGYTDYTARHGDEAAAAFASAFATTTRTTVERFGGTVPELRGDEALAVFGSPRQALRAAIELQAEFLARAESDPAMPLYVGIGIDAGEAVPVGSGFRGGALNTAARLCSEAQAGEILTTQVVTHLARAVEGLTYIDRGLVTLKGLPDKMHVMAVHKSGGEMVPDLLPTRLQSTPQRMPFEDLAESLGTRLSESIQARVEDALSRLPEEALARVPENGFISRTSRSPGSTSSRRPMLHSGSPNTTSNDVIVVALSVAALLVVVLIAAAVVVILHF
jgi:class 3 adenylate cyclase